MPSLVRALRPLVLGALCLTFSGCCCCDPEALTKYAEESGASEELEKRMQEEVAKAQEEMAKAQKAQQEAAEKAAKQQEKQVKVVVAEEKAKPAPKPAVATGAAANRGGKYAYTAFDKKALTGGSLKLEVDDKTGVVKGRFLGQYYRKPFSLAVEGKISKKNDSFELKGKDGESKVTVAGAFENDSLKGKITGKVKGKPIAAPFTAKRRK